jgi:16S rRNA G527 N7-methylase RsmG
LIRNDLRGTLVESTKKKARFLAALAEPLELTLTVSEARFPDSFPMATTAPFDLLTTRAVARAGGIVRAARPLLGKGSRALLWTTRELFAEALAESGFHRGSFHETPGAERRGIGVIECST